MRCLRLLLPRVLVRLLPILLVACSATLAALWTPAAADWWQPAPARDGVWPLLPRPEVVRGFDPPASRWGSGHRGVDLLGHAGQQVRSALGGTITFAAPLAGRGVVVVDHGGVRTTYEPVSASVVVGDVVTRGTAIGLLRRAQSHCFPRSCLHWGLRRGETYLNPLTLVGAGPVRLLPLDVPLDVPLGGPPAFARLAPAVPVASLRPGGGRAGRPGAAVPW
jgi:murein DD-endopeptidase MepM/ murein hydrolase activator NlpD